MVSDTSVTRCLVSLAGQWVYLPATKKNTQHAKRLTLCHQRVMAIGLCLACVGSLFRGRPVCESQRLFRASAKVSTIGTMFVYCV